VLDIHSHDGDGIRYAMPSRLPRLHVRATRASAAAIVTLTGEVDLGTVAKLRDCLDALDGNVVLDLFAVPFLDSSAMSVFAATRVRLLAGGGDLRLRAPQQQVRRVLAIGGLEAMVMGGPG
jgi:anti-anti-sigma factor